MRILIKSAKVVSPKSPYHHKKVDILVEEGNIAQISKSITLTESVEKEVAFDNLHVSSGWFDSSISFGEPGYEERETLENGLLTAAKSGFSTIALNPDSYPIPDNRGSLDYLKKSSQNTATQVYPIGAMTRKGEGEELAELYDMFKSGARGFGDYKKAVKNPNLLKIALQYVQGFGGLIITFPSENYLSQKGIVHEGGVSTKLGLKGIPAMAEEIQIFRDLAILEYTGGKMHIPTVSTKGGIALISAAKEKGLDVSCSVSLSNLFFTDEKLEEFDSNFKVMPPLRSKMHQDALIDAVKNGVVDMVTCEHRPLNIERKKLEFEHADYGSLGLESAFGALNKIFGTEKSIELLTSGKQRFNIEKPEIKVGERAELTLFDPGETYDFQDDNIYSSSSNSMFVGAELKGKSRGIFANNRLIVNDYEA